MIQVEELSKRFRDQVVLKDLSCSFADGQIHGIVGPNGCGKTVLLKCICGFLPPDAGQISERRQRNRTSSVRCSASDWIRC